MDGAELRGLTAALREKKSAVVGPERRKIAEEAVDQLKDFAQRVDDKSVAARALCLAAEETEDELHDSKAAAELFESALRLNPFLERAAQQADALLQRLGQHSGRIQLLRHRATTLDQTKGASDAVRAAAWRQAGHVVRKWGDDPLDGIPLYEKATALDPEVDSLDALADLYALRGDPGDEEQAADIYTSIAEALSGAEAIDYAGRALDLLPDHQDAMVLLENLVPAAQHGRVLRRRLLDYITRAGDDEDADPRRINLARVFAEEGKLKEGVACLAPAVARKNKEAVALREELLEELRLGNNQRRGTSTLVGVPVHYAVSETQSEPKGEITTEEDEGSASAEADPPATVQTAEAAEAKAPAELPPSHEAETKPELGVDPEPDAKQLRKAGSESSEQEVEPEVTPRMVHKVAADVDSPTDYADVPPRREPVPAEAATSATRTSTIEVVGRDRESTRQASPAQADRPTDKPVRPPPPPPRQQAAAEVRSQTWTRTAEPVQQARTEPVQQARTEPIRGEWSTPKVQSEEAAVAKPRTRRPSPPPARPHPPDQLGEDEVEVEVEVEHHVSRPSLVITPVELPPSTPSTDEVARARRRDRERDRDPRSEKHKPQSRSKRRDRASTPPQPGTPEPRPAQGTTSGAMAASTRRSAQRHELHGEPAARHAVARAATAPANPGGSMQPATHRGGHAAIHEAPRLDPNAGLSMAATAPTFPAPMPRERSSSGRYLLWIAGLLGAAAAVAFYVRRPASTSWTRAKPAVQATTVAAPPKPEPVSAPTTDSRAATAGGSVAFRDQTTRLSGADVNREAFFTQLKSLEPDLTKCYQAALERRPGLEGYLVYGLMLGRGKGKEGGTRMLGEPRGSLRDNQLARCVNAILEDAPWPKPGNGQTRVRLPLYFYP